MANEIDSIWKNENGTWVKHGTGVAEEAAARAAAISAEASARSSADTTLQGNINAEASERASADSSLQTAINNKQGKVLTGTTEPASSLGLDGDVYIKYE